MNFSHVMAQYKFFNEVNSLIGMDGPITKGPPPRWQKKNLENSCSSVNASLNSSKQISVLSTSKNNSVSKTPSKRNGSDVVRAKKTPSKTPSKSKSPSRSTTPTPNKGAKTPNGGDRFIPSRSNSNFDLGHFKMNHIEDSELPTPQKEKQRILSENLYGNDISQQKVLAYQNKPPAAPEGFQNPMRIIYTQTKTPASVKNCTRYIPQAPDRILDAPDIVDDYYLNLLDWSSGNLLAVALGTNVYLWNAATGVIEQLPEMEANTETGAGGPSDYICSLAWIQDGDHLAVGTASGTVQLWDCARIKRLRVMTGHSSRVGSLSWNSYILSSGSRSGQIIHHDVRQREHVVSVLNAHTEEVCGLKWSPDGRHLASGANDNVLHIWPVVQGGSLHSQNQPIHSFTSHQAAVKALAWCPWKPNILASGGGTADRCIRLWNVNTAACLTTVDTKSQVCALLWSRAFSELISGHGFANNQLIIWKYPMMNKVAELTGHTARVLHLAMSPDGTTILSAGADETLRLWKCFVPDPAHKKKDATQTKVKSVSLLTRSIR